MTPIEGGLQTIVGPSGGRLQILDAGCGI